MLPKATATGIAGAYGGLVYLSTVLGGWIADRLRGVEAECVVLFGALYEKGDARCGGRRHPVLSRDQPWRLHQVDRTIELDRLDQPV